MRKRTGIILLVVLLLLLTGCAERKQANTETDSLNNFENATLGVTIGSIFDGYSRALYPDTEVVYYNNFSDLFQSLKQGKVDGFLYDKPGFSAVARTDDNLQYTVVPEYMVDIGFCFQKNEYGEQLAAEMSALQAELWEDGTMDALIEKWYGEKEPTQTLERPDFGENAKPFIVAFDSSHKPFTYMLNGQLAGLEVEVIYKFCLKYGYEPEILDVPFASGMAGLSSEKFDVASAYITAERQKSVNFADPYMSAQVVMITYEQEDALSPIRNLRKSFKKTVLDENRWKSILSGFYTTLLISFFAVLIGAAFGFLFFLLSISRKGWLAKPAKALSAISAFIVRGTPSLVLLMIIYYVVFANRDISGTTVAVIGFSMTFGSFVYTNLKVISSGVDQGQVEAAYALGYGYMHTFFKIVLPQTMYIFLPVCREEILNLIKLTSVVGYVAVNDLTKVADIIRSSTFDAFFPLIIATVFYFVLTWAAIALMHAVARRIDPKIRRKKRIIKEAQE